MPGWRPVDLVFHRCIWAGLAFLPVVIANGAADLRIFGWGRGVVLTLCGGPILSAFSYSGFLGAPLGHGGVIQPSCAALGGLALATIVLKEPPLTTRLLGALVIVAGLAVIGFEALTNIGTHALLGDLSFATAGFLFAVFGMLLKLWRIAPTRAVIVTGVLSLVLIPVQWLVFGFERMIAAGLLGEPAASRISGLPVRCGLDLSVYPRRHSARRRARRRLSHAGPAVHTADRLSGAWRGSDAVPVMRPRAGVGWLSIDPEGLIEGCVHVSRDGAAGNGIGTIVIDSGKTSAP